MTNEKSKSGCFTLVLLGTKGAGKSSTGNTILGRQAFTTERGSTSVTGDVAVESGIVDELPVIVHDTPGFCDTDMSEDEKQRLINEKERDLGPCAFILVLRADGFTEEDRETVEKIEKLLGEERLKKTWIIFTRGDELEDRNLTIQEFISENEALKKLIQKYDQRYHVFNNKKGPTKMQVKMLLIKMIQNSLELKASGGRLTRQQTAADSGSSRRIVLLGKSGVGKSAAGNTILEENVFKSAMTMSSVTSECSDAHATVSGRSVSVVDTPGFFDTRMKHDDLVKEIARSIYLSSPGPHALLIVFPVNRFTQQEEEIPQQIEVMFGEEVLKYSIILFTHGDLLEEETIENEIEKNSRLRHLVQQCGGRYHVFDNKDRNNREQVNELLQMIDTMVEQNGGGYYSNEMFEDAQRFRQEKEESKFLEQFESKYPTSASVSGEATLASIFGGVLGGIAGACIGVVSGAALGGAVGLCVGPVGVVVGLAVGAAVGAVSGAATGAATGAILGKKKVGQQHVNIFSK